MNPEGWKDIKITDKESAIKPETVRSRPEKPPHSRKEFREVTREKKTKDRDPKKKTAEKKASGKKSIFDLSREDQAVNRDSKEGKGQQFTGEGGDLSGLNPHAGGTQQGQVAVGKSEFSGSVMKTDLQALAEQLIGKLMVMKTEGQTDTVITIKNIPLLEGANLVVSSFDTAKGEFNIAFHNLTQAAKEILDQKMHQESLKSSLLEKGYQVHIFTTTTTALEDPSKPETNLYAKQEREENPEEQEKQDKDEEEPTS